MCWRQPHICYPIYLMRANVLAPNAVSRSGRRNDAMMYTHGKRRQLVVGDNNNNNDDNNMKLMMMIIIETTTLHSIMYSVVRHKSGNL